MDASMQPQNVFDNSILNLLHRASQCTDEMFMSRSQSDIRPRQLAVLLAIHNNPGAKQTTLVNVTGIDRSTMADIVRRLHAKRFVQRRRVRNDARSYEIKLTEEGRLALREAAYVSLYVDEQVLTALGEEDGSQFVSSLKSLVAKLG